MDLNDLLLHEVDKKQLSSVISSGTQSFLLAADPGYGKRTIAMSLASELTGKKPEHITVIEAVESSISIEETRKLKAFFTLKTLNATDKRVAVLLNAETMTTEAQNSLLKLLEEPPVNCYLILTASRPEQLLGTITSRAQTIRLRNIPQSAVSSYLVGRGFKSLDVEKTLAMTNGLMGVTVSILQGEDTDFVAGILKAKELLGQKHLDRLKSVDALSKDKKSTLLLLAALKTIASAAVKKNNTVDLWKRVLQGSSTAELQLSQNASTKLVLTNLFLSL